MTAILAAEWFAERLPIRFKTWCYEKKTRLASRISLEGGIIRQDRFVPDHDLKAFLSDAREWPDSDDLVLLLSGSCGDRQDASNRISFLIKALRSAGVPTLWGHSGHDASPHASKNNPCPQLDMPINQAISVLTDLCGSGDTGSQRHLILAAPLVQVCKYIGRFGAAGWTTTYACMDDWSQGPGTKWKYDPHAEEFLARSCDFCIAGDSELAGRTETLCNRAASGVLGVTRDRNQDTAPRANPFPGLLGIASTEWASRLERKNVYRLRGEE